MVMAAPPSSGCFGSSHGFPVLAPQDLPRAASEEAMAVKSTSPLTGNHEPAVSDEVTNDKTGNAAPPTLANSGALFVLANLVCPWCVRVQQQAPFQGCKQLLFRVPWINDHCQFAPPNFDW